MIQSPSCYHHSDFFCECGASRAEVRAAQVKVFPRNLMEENVEAVQHSPLNTLMIIFRLI